MPDLNAATADLKAVLGDFLSRERPDGIFHVQVGGPGSVPGLQDLDIPELHVDLLPGEPTPEKRRGLEQIGYVQEGESWNHSGGWRVVFPDHDSGWRANRQLLREYLTADAGAAAQYHTTFQAQGREAADTALLPTALAHYAATVGFSSARYVAQLLQGLDFPWMFAAGLALNLHLGRLSRAHDDLDVVLPYETQEAMRERLHDWRLDAALNGEYHEWTALLEPPLFQVHARHADLPDVLMLDLMFADLSGGLWRFRRNPAITLPLSEARRFTPDGLPYLAPHAALLYKAPRPDQPPRSKDEQDFARMLPVLTPAERDWLANALAGMQMEHPWLSRLQG